jgi:hypothetical protein
MPKNKLEDTKAFKEAEKERDMGLLISDPLVTEIWNRHKAVEHLGYFNYSENGAKTMIADAILLGMAQIRERYKGMRSRAEIVKWIKDSEKFKMHKFAFNATLYCLGREDLSVENYTDKRFNKIVEELEK